jgi:anti-sigma regulatory factor (Ser/Thr protein kinase)
MAGDTQGAGFLLPPARDAFARPAFAGHGDPASAAALDGRGIGACQLGDRSAGDDRMTTRTSARESLTVPGRPNQAAAARQFTARRLGPGHPRAETAILLVSELVTNSLRHSASARDGGTITITVITSPGGLVRVEVTDDGAATMPAVRPRCPADEEGRGMQLVSALASTWGCQREGGGAGGSGAGSRTTTWFELTPGAQPADAAPPPVPARGDTARAGSVGGAVGAARAGSAARAGRPGHE